MSTKDLKEKGTHFLLLTGSTLLMAVGTYFFKFNLTLHLAESPVWQSLLLKPV